MFHFNLLMTGSWIEEQVSNPDVTRLLDRLVKKKEIF